MAAFGPLRLVSTLTGNAELVVPYFNVDVVALEAWDVSLNDELLASLMYLDLRP